MFDNKENIIYKVGIYIRLSKEDVDRGFNESESIINQKNLLTEYVKNQGDSYQTTEIYIDQGYTGMNFKRPAFQKLIKDIELQKINMVITKDLSRLGRDYIETGEYVEKWFPEHNIRYVSLTDGIDTFSNNTSNDIAPFKAILNDMYSKDLSKKIRTALHTMRKEGKWVGGKTALGYIKDPYNKNHLIIDENEAQIIRTIFQMANKGTEIGNIRNFLNYNQIPTASKIRYNKESFWENKTIKNILQNEVYIGNTVQNKRSRINYKNRRIRKNPKESWIIVESTHEPIIDKEIFYRIQKIISSQKYSRNEKKYNYLLDGLLFCYECKHKIGIRGIKNNNLYLVCNNYRRNSKIKICTSHGFNYNKLETQILIDINKFLIEIDEKTLKKNIGKSKKQIEEELRNPTPEFMKSIIYKIEIHQDKQIDIIYNFEK